MEFNEEKDIFAKKPEEQQVENSVEEKPEEQVEKAIEENTEEITDKKVEEIVEEEAKTKEKTMKPIIACRVLFISLIDKIYLITLLLILIVATIANFSGDFSSISYGFWERLVYEILIFIGMVILYLLCNWLYKCTAKTMLCLTPNEVYKEYYYPFIRTELSIPLNKITSVQTIKIFWIFRAVIIKQYNKLPLIFFTWKNQEFKDKLNELITTDKEKVENEYKSKNIITKKFFIIFIIIFTSIIILIGIARLISYMTSEERNIPGTYAFEQNEIILNNDGTCNVDDITKEDVTDCNWSYNKETNTVDFYYEYSYYSYYWGYSTRYVSMDGIVEYDKNNKTLTYDNKIFNKQ